MGQLRAMTLCQSPQLEHMFIWLLFNDVTDQQMRKGGFLLAKYQLIFSGNIQLLSPFIFFPFISISSSVKGTFCPFVASLLSTLPSLLCHVSAPSRSIVLLVAELSLVGWHHAFPVKSRAADMIPLLLPCSPHSSSPQVKCSSVSLLISLQIMSGRYEITFRVSWTFAWTQI